MIKENQKEMAEKTGKKRVSILMAALLAAGMLTATACGMFKNEFKCVENTEKRMTFEAVNASKGGMIMIGTLEVAEGEELEITPDLKKGMLKLEFIQEDEEQKDALITAEVSGTGTQAYGIPAGSYMVRVTVTEKAKGTVTAEIQAE